MAEIWRRKIYAGYYDRYDRKPFYVVCEAADYDTGEVNIIMQEYHLTILDLNNANSEPNY